jgi:trans-aconitate 2-methyltransferase
MHARRAERYTFGDSDPAARRLAEVAAVFEAPTRAFLAEVVNGPVGVAVDLGCGPGHTTELLDRYLHPRRLAGLDRSAAFLERARRRVPAASFHLHDVTRTPLPTGPADLLFARFLLTHLPQPGRVMAAWAGQLAPGGLLLVDEVEWIRTRDPALAGYLRVVAAVLDARGHLLEVGPVLDALPDPPGLERRTSQVAVHEVDPARAAAMFRTNLSVWRHDPQAHDLMGTAELDRLDRNLAGRRTTPITWGLRQIAWRRVDAGRPGLGSGSR